MSIARESLRSNAALFEMSKRHQEISRPTFIAAAPDNAARRQAAERLHAEVPSSELLLLAGAGRLAK